jgi:hypothetical protein
MLEADYTEVLCKPLWNEETNYPLCEIYAKIGKLLMSEYLHVDFFPNGLFMNDNSL